MVPRLRYALGGALALALLAAPPALGANARVAIADFKWSKTPVELDLGEHVTWYWTGPDLLHSVTGVSPNAEGIDSDPGQSPNHPAGWSFSHTFDEAGTYEFRCELHAVVRGTVVVSNQQGDPVAEPDPIPETNIDAIKPRLTEVRLDSTKFGKRGTTLNVTLNERATIDAEFWRRPKGKRPRKYAGWQEWQAHIGYNHLEDFGTRGPHLRPRPGRYVAEIRATDESHNRSETRVRFTIR